MFHGKRHSESMGAAEVEAFLTHLATERGVAAATQNLAKSALLFMYKEVLGVQLPWLDEILGAKNRDRLLEGLRLRIKDVDFERRELVVRSGKGAKDRVTVLPENLVLPAANDCKWPPAKYAADAGSAVLSSPLPLHEPGDPPAAWPPVDGASSRRVSHSRTSNSSW